MSDSSQGDSGGRSGSFCKIGKLHVCCYLLPEMVQS
jgi:hypothetical protein